MIDLAIGLHQAQVIAIIALVIIITWLAYRIRWLETESPMAEK